MMKAITIWQPWAQLLIEGVKIFETRSWPAPEKLIGQRMAIHAAARKVKDSDIFGSPCNGLIESIVRVEIDSGVRVTDFPRGAVLGTARLQAVYQIEPNNRVIDFYKSHLRGLIEMRQLPLGDFSPGRFAWKFDQHDMFDNPIPAKGQQRLWNWSQPCPT